MNRKYLKVLFFVAILSLGAVFVPSPACAIDKALTNSIGMELVLIPAGSFMMGAGRARFDGQSSDERPQHKVTISKSFYLGKYEVTQAQWTAVMGNNPSKFKGRSNPVENISWNEIQEFIQRLNQKEGHNRYRLPTEAEWEYAARAGASEAYFFGNDAGALGQYAWYGDRYRGNSGEKTHPVGQKQPNPWGLYDIYGNVWELVADLYGEKYYAESPEIDPKGPSGHSSSRVIRGGAWGKSADLCRSAWRGAEAPYARSIYIGFRLALSPE